MSRKVTCDLHRGAVCYQDCHYCGEPIEHDCVPLADPWGHIYGHMHQRCFDNWPESTEPDYDAVAVSELRERQVQARARDGES
jgi:hypothetical protein